MELAFISYGCSSQLGEHFQMPVTNLSALQLQQPPGGDPIASPSSLFEKGQELILQFLLSAWTEAHTTPLLCSHRP